ncbi:histidine kinase-like protein [Kineococcus xinjiangensis]|uniref:Histidine kinase-like protein n=1 Tax=Kineococcus xinjiangensis TaxID=512762 RepID=A0A2S6IDT2_9ACTN|nr:ATP-binding protein [Kineococcus xinjiangensis]PPK92359.1 histidine kinase-like protein [Kineococcus xinjiangensis]
MPLGSRVLPVAQWAAFAHDASSVPQARHLLRDVLDRAGADETTRAEVEVVLSEIIGNSVRHARPLQREGLPGGIEVACRLVPGGEHADQHVELSVTDGGSASSVHPVHARESDTSGRGLRIVDSLTTEWGVVEDLDDLTRTVWATFGGPRRRAPR